MRLRHTTHATLASAIALAAGMADAAAGLSPRGPVFRGPSYSPRQAAAAAKKKRLRQLARKARRIERRNRK